MSGREANDAETIEVPRSLIQQFSLAAESLDEVLRLHDELHDQRVLLGEEIGRVHSVHAELEQNLSEMDQRLSAITGRSMVMRARTDQMNEELAPVREFLSSLSAD